MASKAVGFHQVINRNPVASGALFVLSSREVPLSTQPKSWVPISFCPIEIHWASETTSCRFLQRAQAWEGDATPAAVLDLSRGIGAFCAAELEDDQANWWFSPGWVLISIFPRV